MSKPVILTGLRANNDLHIGNYFGALLPLVDMARQHANDYEINLFVPDLHSFTTPIDHSTLQEQVLENLRIFMAVGAGLPLYWPNIHIYRQSRVPAHSELTWILDCFTGMGEMGRMTQYKDKSANQNSDRISVGLFNYPVLMAADILLYGASYVPVGDDQSQHVEFARDIAMRMNTRFGDLFVVPKSVKEQHEFFGRDQGLRIKDLVNPTKKMSKSDESGRGVIFLNDTPEAAIKKIMSATTDSENEVRVDPVNKPGITNLLDLQKLFPKSKAEEFNPINDYAELKHRVGIKVSGFLQNFQSKLAEDRDAEILEKLEADEKLMNERANATLLKVQKAVGLR